MSEMAHHITSISMRESSQTWRSRWRRPWRGPPPAARTAGRGSAGPGPPHLPAEYGTIHDSGDLTVPVEAMALNLYGTGKGPGRSIGFF